MKNKTHALVSVYSLSDTIEIRIKDSNGMRVIEKEKDFYKIKDPFHDYLPNKISFGIKVNDNSTLQNLIETYDFVKSLKRVCSYKELIELQVEKEKRRLQSNEENYRRNLEEVFYLLAISVMKFDKECHEAFDSILSYI